MTTHTRNEDDDEWDQGFLGGEAPDAKADPAAQPLVGYKNPPDAYKWKKGQSGNPSGRRKAPPLVPVPGILEAIAFEMAEEIEVGSNGKKLKMTVAQVVAKKLKADLLSSEPLVRLKTMTVLARLGMGDAVQTVHNHLETLSAANDIGWDSELEAAYQLIEREFRDVEADKAKGQL